MTAADITVNALVAVGYFHFVVFLLRDLANMPADRRKAPLTLCLAGIFLTCGIHHSETAIHLLHGQGKGQLLSVLVVGSQVVFATTWVYLRYESLIGGRGDRQVRPPSLGYAVLWAIYYVMVISATMAVIVMSDFELRWGVVSNYGVYVAYTIIAWRLFATQYHDRGSTKPWSLSGFVMSGYFGNCALSHLVFASYVGVGGYVTDGHHALVDWLAFITAVAFIVIAQRQKRPPKDLRATEAQPIT